MVSQDWEGLRTKRLIGPNDLSKSSESNFVKTAILAPTAAPILAAGPVHEAALDHQE